MCVNTAVLIKFSLFEADCVTEQADSYHSSVSTIECFINVLISFYHLSCRLGGV